MNTKDIREKFNLTQEELALRFDIPLGTIRNWDARNCMPSYVHRLIMCYISLDTVSSIERREYYSLKRDYDELHNKYSNLKNEKK